MEPNETTEEPELTAPYYLTSSLGYQQQYIDNAEDELAEASEALRVASREFRAAELRNTIAVANLEKTKLALQTTQESIAKWIADERKRIVRQKEAEARAAELAAEKAEQEAAEAAARGEEEPTEDEPSIAERANAAGGVDLGSMVVVDMDTLEAIVATHEGIEF